MKEIIAKGVDALKDVVTYRCAGLPSSALAALLSEVDVFRDLIVAECGRLEERLAVIQQENELLRRLAGVKESDMVPPLLAQGEELRVARERMVALQETLLKARQEKDDLARHLAAAEAAVQAVQRRKDEDTRQFEKALADIRGQFRELQEAVRARGQAKDGVS